MKNAIRYAISATRAVSSAARHEGPPHAVPVLRKAQAIAAAAVKAHASRLERQALTI